jgi:dolichyl-phosphate-mannose-protein mannosyltransferase
MIGVSVLNSVFFFALLKCQRCLVPQGDQKYYRSPFLRDFWHLNVAMMTSNNALIPDPDKEDILASKPTEWPFLDVGLRMCGWGEGQLKYYLLGTPVIWWGGSLSLILALVTLGVYILRAQRKYVDMNDREWDHFIYVTKIAFFGWALHYGMCPGYVSTILYLT